MKKWLSILLAACLLLYPLATFGIDYGSQTSQAQQGPPVAQTLVREGDFAIKLAAELNLGKPENEAEAEDTLARAGVAPMNGWISDYPVTPEIIGQLKDSIVKATAEGKLTMTSEEATKGLYNLALQMNQATPAGPGPGTVPEGQSNPSVVNNYYYDAGPPIVTYYPPPPDYVYLYDWVPFPVFWFGFWFPGFFICHNFTTTVIVTNTAFVTRTAIVSNRIINPVTRTVTVIDPVVRTSTGAVRPMTALRSGSGQMFRTVSDMKRGVSLSGVTAVSSGTAITGSKSVTGGFKTLEARKGAQAIHSRSVQGMRSQRGPQGTMTRGGGMRNAAPRGPGRSYNAPSTGSQGRSAASYSPSRTNYSRPIMRDGSSGYGRSYASPRPTVPPRSYGGSMNRGGGATRSFPGTGWNGRG
jgi:hypothetical protein